MKREVFFNYVKENILGFLPEEYKEAEVRIFEDTKNNDTKVLKLYICKPNETVIPSMSLEPYYLMTQDIHSICDVMQKIAEDYLNCKLPEFKLKEGLNENNIICHVINKEKNRELLEKTPYRNFLDLAIIYRMVIERGKNGIASRIISNDLMEYLQIESEEELFRKAIKNTFKLFPVIVSPMGEVLSALSTIPDNMLKQASMLHIMTNEDDWYGASALLHTELFKELSEAYENCDLWVLPASLHEIIVVPIIEDSFSEQLWLVDLISNVNSTQVANEDVLSNSLYRYNNVKNCIELAEVSKVF